MPRASGVRQSWQIDARGNEVAGTTSVYYYDGDDLIAVSDGFGSWREVYAYGPTGLFWKRGILDGTGSRWYHADWLGSVKILSDVNVNVTDTYNYDAFGNITNQTDPTHNPFRYVGQLGYYRRNVLATPSPPEYGRGQDRLMLLGARWYDPVIGRFLTQDPMGYAGGLNLYSYVGNNPVGFADPLGLAKDDGFLGKVESAGLWLLSLPGRAVDAGLRALAGRGKVSLPKLCPCTGFEGASGEDADWWVAAHAKQVRGKTQAFPGEAAAEIKARVVEPAVDALAWGAIGAGVRRLGKGCEAGGTAPRKWNFVEEIEEGKRALDPRRPGALRE